MIQDLIAAPAGTVLYVEPPESFSGQVKEKFGLVRLRRCEFEVGDCTSVFGSIAHYRTPLIRVAIENAEPSADLLNEIGKKAAEFLYHAQSRDFLSKILPEAMKFQDTLRISSAALKTFLHVGIDATIMDLLVEYGTIIPKMQASLASAENNIRNLILDLSNRLKVVEISNSNTFRGWPIRLLARDLSVSKAA